MKQTTIKKPIKKPTARTRKKPVRGFGRLKQVFRRRIKLLFVPHKLNQYRPHLVRRQGLLVVVMLVIGVQIGYNFAVTGRVLGQKELISTVDLLADTNGRRAEQGLAPLKMDDRLSQAAFLKGQDMLNKQYWSHDAPDGTTPWFWFGKAGYNYAYAGENLAKNFATADAATIAWMASPDHKANILDKHYTQAGFAVVDGQLNGKQTSLIVALYGEPAEATATAAVAGVHNAALIVDAPAPHGIGLKARLSVALQSISPAAISAVVIIMIAASVAATAHLYRKRLPRVLRQSWYRHHGVIKAGGMMSLCVIMLLFYSGGQI